MRHFEAGFAPCARYSTSWRLSVTGAPPESEGADIVSVYDLLNWSATPIPDESLKRRETGERGGIGPQHPRPKTGGANKGEFLEGVKFRLREPALRPHQHAPRTRVPARLLAPVPGGKRLA